MPRLNAHIVATLGMDVEGPTDAELLKRFFTERDSGSFELLVWRHASLVLRVCRSVLKDWHEAEDAAQATFLSLARQAGSIREANLPGWLFRVARRVSARALRRVQKQIPPADINFDQLAEPVVNEESDHSLEQILHEELASLPQRYQIPILLCFFEGHTYSQAAQCLGWPIGTIAGRVSRAKKLLESRLARRGVCLTGLVLAPAVVSSAFARGTASAAVAFSQGNVLEVPKRVCELANRELRGMFTAKAIKYLGILSCGVLALSLGSAKESNNPTTQAPALKPEAAVKQPAAPKLPAPVIEKTYAIVPVTTELQRRLIAHDATSPIAAIVLLDGTAFFRDENTLNLEEIDLDGPRKSLLAYKANSKQHVYFISNYRTRIPDYSQTGLLLLDSGWEGLGRRAGFGRAQAERRFSNDAWKDWISPLRENADASAEEKSVGDERALAYPVRTPLSRVLTQSSAGPAFGLQVVDGVIFVLAKMDHRKDDWVSADVEKSVSAAITALKLPKGKRISFHFNLEPADFSESTGNRLDSLTKKWVAEHDLERGYFSD